MVQVRPWAQPLLPRPQLDWPGEPERLAALRRPILEIQVSRPRLHRSQEPVAEPERRAARPERKAAAFWLTTSYPLLPLLAAAAVQPALDQAARDPDSERQVILAQDLRRPRMAEAEKIPVR